MVPLWQLIINFSSRKKDQWYQSHSTNLLMVTICKKFLPLLFLTNRAKMIYCSLLDFWTPVFNQHDTILFLVSCCALRRIEFFGSCNQVILKSIIVLHLISIWILYVYFWCPVEYSFWACIVICAQICFLQQYIHWLFLRYTQTSQRHILPFFIFKLQFHWVVHNRNGIC